MRANFCIQVLWTVLLPLLSLSILELVGQDVSDNTEHNDNYSEAPNNSNDWSKLSAVLLKRMADLGERCKISREPKLIKPPDLHFYSRKTSDEGVQFTLNFTVNEGHESNSGLAQREEIRQKLFQTNYYDASFTTYFIIHGFLGTHEDHWMPKLRDRILNAGDANVFLVDWSGGSRPKLIIDYPLAVANAVEVAKYLGAFIKNLAYSATLRDLSGFHLIGISLGAQMSGLIGYHLDGSLGRITALDPAGPCFWRDNEQMKSLDVRLHGHLEVDSPRRRLSTSSAKLVVAIHSDTRLFGLNENCAHFDIYLNGGAQQLNCSDEQIGCNHEASLRTILLPAPMINYEEPLSDDDVSRESDKCYSIAYLCSSWQAFQAGECGYCNENDARCIPTGLFLGQHPPVNVNQNLDLSSYQPNQGIANSDIIFNKESNPISIEQKIDNSSNVIDFARHFTRIGLAPSLCLYQYQVLIVTDQIDSKSQKVTPEFYLEIPLDAQNSTKGRLVKVSHLIAHNSSSRFSIEESLNELMEIPVSDRNSDYYTALITFNSTVDCQNANSNRVLCKPIERISATRLYSPEIDLLHHVRYVALNYLSGSTKVSRKYKSQLLQPDSPEKIERPHMSYPILHLRNKKNL